MKKPTNNPITQTEHGPYNAVDYSYLPDPNIYAPESGKVTSYAYAGQCGNNLQIQGDSGYLHGFCHLEKTYVRGGDKVTAGQKIGVMGYTGYTIPAGPAGRHLHHVMTKGGKWYYPPSITKEPAGTSSSKGDSNMFQNDKEVQEAYMLLRGTPGTAAERKGWIGQPKQRFFQVGKAEADSVRKQLADVKKALANEQAKPPKEIVRTIEKVIEKPVGEEEAVRGFFGKLLDLVFKKG